jgi:hypothetical protein
VRDQRARRLYRALLGLFPQGFRRQRGQEMERMFAAMRADRVQEGRVRATRFWLSVTGHTLRGAAGEWFSVVVKTTRKATGVAGGEPMSRFTFDVRYAWRRMLRQPLYSGLILLLMIVGIAGNAAVFRIFDGLFLRPLPFEDAGQLLDLDEKAPQWNLEHVGIAYPDFVEWRRSNRSFASNG